LRQLLWHPIPLLKANLQLRLRPLVATPRLVRELFFTPETPQAIVDHCFANLQDESYRAFLDTIFMLPRPGRVRAPVLVLGAGRDAIISTGGVRRTGRAYRTEAEIFPGMGHDLMLDVGWERVADRVAAWARERGQEAR
jgi:pimeloyl-ACP methyl ester carboxylesterase